MVKLNLPVVALSRHYDEGVIVVWSNYRVYTGRTDPRRLQPLQYWDVFIKL